MRCPGAADAAYWWQWRCTGGLALCLILLAAACNPIYHPDGVPNPADANAAGMQVVTYETNDGLALGSWYRAARAGQPTLVYFHGNAGHLGDRLILVRPYLEAGYGVLLAGYRGYGGNPGRPGEEGFYADGRAALAWLADSRVVPERTVLFGESLGTGVAVQMAVEHPVAGLILQSPFTSVVDVGRDAVPWLPVALLMTDRFDSLSKIPRITAPLLLIHGEADRVVPVRFGRRLFEAASEPKTAHFVPGAGHNDLYRFEISVFVIAFLETLADG